jgi:hypothetical protein
MTDIERIQREIAAWSDLNFPDTELSTAALGTSEELGEFYEAALEMGAAWGKVARGIVKGQQAARGTTEEWMRGLPKELADCFIKLCDVATRSGVDLAAAVDERWATVLQRTTGSAEEKARAPQACADPWCMASVQKSDPEYPFCGPIHAQLAAQRETQES